MENELFPQQSGILDRIELEQPVPLKCSDSKAKMSEVWGGGIQVTRAYVAIDLTIMSLVTIILFWGKLLT